MEVESPPLERLIPSPTELIIRKLARFGVPKEHLKKLQPGLLAFTFHNKSDVPALVSIMLPTLEETLELLSIVKSHGSPALIKKIIYDWYQESMIWLQWLMFDSEPEEVLNSLAKNNATRGACGTVWGSDDIAYQCRTCEHDPTCAICVPCFQNGNHEDHDYCLIQTSGGCCDCGDVTAWKREGFCSKHGGPEQVQPLPEGIVKSLKPVIDTLLLLWQDSLLRLKSSSHKNGLLEGPDLEFELLRGFSSVVIGMLLEFCKCSESLLRFIATRICSLSTAFLDILLKAECVLPKDVCHELRELILKLLCEPKFKYEFSKVFINNYAGMVNAAIGKSNAGIDPDLEESPLLSSFSVQIFTVPILTPSLVKQNNLLGILFGCLEDLLRCCITADGQLLMNRWHHMRILVFRLVEDTRLVMSHIQVPKFVLQERSDICQTWVDILSLIQGMDPQKRVTRVHVEEENENWQSSLMLEHVMGNVNLLFVSGAFASVDVDENKETDRFYTGLHDGDSLQHAESGRVSEEGSSCGLTRSEECVTSAVTSYISEETDDQSVPYAVRWIASECLGAIDRWLKSPNNLRFKPISKSDVGDSLVRINGKSKLRSKNTMKVTQCVPAVKSQVVARSASKMSSFIAQRNSIGMASKDSGFHNINLLSTSCGDEKTGSSKLVKDCAEANLVSKSDLLGILGLKEWPDLSFDVGTEGVSVHLPLHRLFSILLYRTLQEYHQESTISDSADETSCTSSWGLQDLFGLLLRGCQPPGFAAFMMEHPLRLRVFCAQVRAGMWRKNGLSVLSICENYHNVRWCEQALELDIFMLQFCAAVAPADIFVRRILERYGLLNYLSLKLESSNEFESALVQDMLTLIIQIVEERQLCGLSTVEKLKKELIYRLAIGDATHSQLLKALPRSLSRSHQLQHAIDTVAVYSHPSGMKQGRYSLRKACFRELDLYHPRWNSREMQLAEERYMRFCNASAMTVQLPHWTKIFHPLDGIFRIAVSRVVVEILRAVVYYAVAAVHPSSSRAPDGVLLRALHLLSLGLDICRFHIQRTNSKLNSGTGSTDISDFCLLLSSDGDVLLPLIVYAREVILVDWPAQHVAPEQQSLLSLLVLLMRNCKKDYGVNELGTFDSGFGNITMLTHSLLVKFGELDTGCRVELERLAPEIKLQSSGNLPGYDRDLSCSASDAESRKTKARERQAAIMAEMRDAQSKFIASLSSLEADELDSSKLTLEQTKLGEKHSLEEGNAVCSLCRDASSRNPVSYLIHLQKSRLTSFLERAPPLWHEISENELVNFPPTDDVSDLSVGNSDYSTRMNSRTHLLDLLRSAVNVVIHGGRQSGIEHSPDPLSMSYYDADNTISHDRDGDTIPDSNHVQESSQHSSLPGTGQDVPVALDEDLTLLREYLQSMSQLVSNTSQLGGNASAASGDTITKSGNHNATFDGFGPADCAGIHISSCGHAVHQECRNLYLLSLRRRYASRSIFEGAHIVDPERGEFLCPVCRRFANSILPLPPGAETIKQPVMPCSSIATSSSSSLPGSRKIMIVEALAFLQQAEKCVRKSGYRKTQSSGLNETAIQTVQPLLQNLFSLYFPERGDTLLTSGRVSHSIILWNVLIYSLVCTEVAARHAKSDFVSRQRVLNNAMDSTTGFILSLLLQIVQKTQTQNHVQVLLRSRGMQLLCQSISSGISLDDFPRGNQKGIMSQLLNGGKGHFLPDLQFWKRTADPVLVHDPFSSLMWVLFCLPIPFPSWIETFLPLVHLFYSVCVMQALITCVKYRTDMSELVVGQPIITSVQKLIVDDTVCQHYFASNYVETTCSPLDMLHLLLLPYLRRCALLWQMLRCSAPAPFGGNYLGQEDVYQEDMQHISEHVDGISTELKEVHQLAGFFHIPAMEVVLEDEAFNAISLRWIDHFHKGLAVRSYPRMYCSPAVQFQLIRLPRLYQDLLQRLISLQNFAYLSYYYVDLKIVDLLCFWPPKFVSVGTCPDFGRCHRYIKPQCLQCQSNLKQPALCLLCGRLCSPRHFSCCRENECQQHALSCAAGIGVFLLIKRTTILLQRSSRQSLWPSPYLDAFGEEAEMRDAQSKFIASLSSLEADELDSSKLTLEQTKLGEKHSLEEGNAVCSLCRDASSRNPVSYLIHLQKSRLTSFLERAPPLWHEISENELVNFPPTDDVSDLSVGNSDYSTRMNSRTHLLDLLRSAVNVVIHGGRQSGIEHSPDPLSMSYYDADNTISHDRDGDTIPDSNHVQESSQHSSLPGTGQDVPVALDEDLTLLREYLQSMSQLVSNTSQLGGNASAASGDTITKSGNHNATFDGFGPADCAGIHISSCGHAVHQECRNLYLLSLRRRYASRSIFEGAHIVDPERGEFLCPVCRRFANSILPFPPGAETIKQPVMPCSSIATSSSSSLPGSRKIMIVEALAFLQQAEKCVRKSGYRKTQSSGLNETAIQTVQPLLQNLFSLYFPERGDTLLTSGRVSHSIILWNVLIYSLVCTEVAARHAKSDFVSRQRVLNNAMDSTTGFILSLLLQIVQKTQTQNHVQVLLRSRGMQLLCQSISSGISLDDFPRGNQKGIMSQLLNGGKGHFLPDLQFWKRTADPVLVHDPFSSLMWVLFCLPIPFPSWIETFLPLVHLFYSVCVMQALITCVKYRTDMSELVVGQPIITSVQKLIVDDTVCQHYFASNYVETTCSPLDMLHLLLLPYLRRCALLWQMLRCSAPAPFGGNYLGQEDVYQEDMQHISEHVDGISTELKEVHQLAGFFHIPAMEVVLEDEAFNAISLRWIDHFHKGLAVRSYPRMYCSPAVQFQLIRLPRLYQDLLQRLISLQNFAYLSYYYVDLKIVDLLCFWPPKFVSVGTCPDFGRCHRYIKPQCLQCQSNLKQPALCLLCGRLCSPRHFSCCRENECQQHALSCAAGIGVFLLIKRTTILLQRSSRQSLWPSPYLDAFGEEDVDLIRGKPLYFNEDRYATLTYLVVSHGLDRSSEVLRHTTVDSLFDL